MGIKLLRSACDPRKLLRFGAKLARDVASCCTAQECSLSILFRNCSVNYKEDCTVESGDDLFYMCADDTVSSTPIQDVLATFGAGDKETVFWTGGAFGPSCYYPDPDLIPTTLAEALGLSLVDADDVGLTYQTETCNDSPCTIGTLADPCDCNCYGGNATLGTYCCWGPRDALLGDATFTFTYSSSGYFSVSNSGGPGTGVAPCPSECDKSRSCTLEQWERRITGGFTATDCEVCTTRQYRTTLKLDPYCCEGVDTATSTWGSDEAYCLSPQLFQPLGDCNTTVVTVRFYSYGGYANTTTTTVLCEPASCTVYERTEIVTDRTAINGTDAGPTCVQSATTYENERIDIITGVDITGGTGASCAACRQTLLAGGI